LSSARRLERAYNADLCLFALNCINKHLFQLMSDFPFQRVGIDKFLLLGALLLIHSDVGQFCLVAVHG